MIAVGEARNGVRKNSDALVRVDAERSLRAGCVWNVNENGVLLTVGVPIPNESKSGIPRECLIDIVDIESGEVLQVYVAGQKVRCEQRLDFQDDGSADLVEQILPVTRGKRAQLHAAA